MVKIDTGNMTPEQAKVAQSNADQMATLGAGNYSISPEGNVIPITTLAGSPNPTILPTQQTINYSAQIAQLQAMSDSLTKQKEADANDPMKAVKDYTATLTPPPSGVDTYANTLGQTPEQITQSGETSQKLVNDLQAQLNNITAGAQVATQQLEAGGGFGTGGTSSFLSSEASKINKEAAIKGLPIAATLAVAQGNNALAQQHIDKLFELQQTDAKNKVDYNNNLIEKFYDFATKKEQGLLDAEKARLAQENNDRVNNLNQAQTWATTAISNGQGSLAGQIMALDPKDSNYQTKLGQLASQIKAKAPTTQTTPIVKTGGLQVSEADISKNQQLLTATTGKDGFVNSKTYMDMYDEWVTQHNGLPADFFKYFPPDKLNPNDASIPQSLRNMIAQYSKSTDTNIF